MKELFKKVKKGFGFISKNVKAGCQRIAVPFGKVSQTKPVKAIVKAIKIPFIGYLLLACIMNFLLEVLSRHSFGKALLFIKESPMVFLYNAVIIFVTLSLVMFAKRKIFATVFVCAVWIISAFANYIVLCFRTTPFSAVDVLMIRNVMTMLDKYMTKWQLVLSIIGVLMLIALLIYLYIRLPKTEKKRNPFRASAYVCMCIVLVATLTKVAVETQTVSDNFGNLAYAYNDYGFAYCFSNSIIDVGIGKPKGYSEAVINEIVEDLTYDKSEVVFLTQEEAEEKAAELASAETGTASENDIENISLETVTEVTEESTDLKETSESNSEEVTETDSEGTAENDSEKVTETDSEGNTENESEEVTETGSEGTTENDLKAADTLEEDEKKYYENEEATKEFPNIIIIQLESIFDTKYMKNFYTSENPMPTLSKLKQKYSSGLFTVPAVGAGTANTEFEVQTGMSTQFFGAGEYPFKTVIRDVTCDSMAYDLKRYGYATAGFHNNDATFYERYIDYSNLGFDVFTGMEHMYSLNYTPRGWAKDDQLDDLMIERLKQTEGRDYITTITVQCHGRYPKKHTATLNSIECYFTGKYAEDTEKQAAWEYYINMCKETDNMIKDLLAELNKLDEPTVVFMYGDHLPSLNLEEDDLSEISLYQTEWIMWDNMRLDVEKKDLMAYQASTYIFERLGIQGGLMQNFHRKYMDTENQEDYLDKMELLEYDTLYGKNYAFDGQNPFPQTDMKMGIRDIQIRSYQIRENEVRIFGEGFNEFSEVYVDGKKIDKIDVNALAITVSLDDFVDGNEFYIAQEGDDHIVLSVTNTLEIKQQDASETEDIQSSEMSETSEEVNETP